ncbi:type II toxin-antitoxin system VapC family toxin [Aulosira sp. FACHB-615]|uniref:type II toxin-antitoxin system VapC family toxin n=1 Tax=Aulosira sp. FACHB-615 TaxID=2692777 RepID=UPI001F549522|nr:type II toxin-antitoxin system VapC family toxin [Aulosira sp. FACHB-615]
MKLLLDTQAFLWFVLNDRSLSQVACNLIVDPLNDILLSPVSYWEIAIKVSIGKYQIPESFATWIERSNLRQRIGNITY